MRSSGKGVTSLAKELKKEVDEKEVKVRILKYFTEVLRQKLSIDFIDQNTVFLSGDNHFQSFVFVAIRYIDCRFSIDRKSLDCFAIAVK